MVLSIFGGSLSNLVEWYDWYAYSSFALYFSKAFFPQGDRTTQLLNAAAVFAIGFLIRPLGSWLMGIYADRVGRRAGMQLSMLIMGIGSLAVGVIPGYAAIGIASPILLILARIIQGLSVGGQYGISATYLSEISSKKRRGFLTSFLFVTQLIGLFFVMATLLLLQHFLPAGDLARWGWRIPFILGALLAGLGLLVMTRIEETRSFEVVRSKSVKVAPWGTLFKYPREFAIVFFLTMAGTIAFQNYATYMPKFLVNTSGFTPDAAAQIATGALVVFTLLHPLAGWLSDLFGRKALLVTYTALATLYTVPAMSALAHSTSEFNAFLILTGAMIPLSLYTSISALFKAELFPTEIRAFGVGLAHSLAVAVFGGTAELIALWLKQQGEEPLYYWYMAGTLGVAFVTTLLMRDTKKFSRIEEA
jgi:MHS family alpha-ketoglutarate permease-like MFS transporter